MPPELHEDFGEKIGGAKKDQWKLRGLMVDDLAAMNDREAEKYVTKDNVWKKPNYQALVDNGVPAGVVFYIKKVRDSLATGPVYRYTDHTPERRLFRQQQYIETVRQIQALTEGVRTVQDALSAYERFFVGNGYLEPEYGSISGRHFTLTQKFRDNSVLTSKLRETMRVSSEAAFDRDFTKEAQRQQFCIPKEQKIPRGFSVHFHDGKGYSRGNDWKENTYYVTRGYTILKTNLATKEEAVKWAQEYAKAQTKSGKTKFTPPQLQNVRRTGPDFRGGNEIAGQHYLDTFGFRGGEFGNWMNQNDRQASLNMGFEALKDLAAALQISDKDIAYQGTLAIAFGARGSGNAAAHYEPMRKVINLTKLHGAGSLAHEWWHGFDDYLGQKFGAKGLLTEEPRLYPLAKKLVDAMKYKQASPEEAASLHAKQIERTVKNAAGWADSAVLYYVKKQGSPLYMERYERLKGNFLEGRIGSADLLNDLKKAITGRVIPKGERQTLEMYEYQIRQQRAAEPAAVRVETDFYRDSKRMGAEHEKDGGYWDSDVEMSARAFACYVMDKLPYRSDYLVGHAECAVGLFVPRNGEPEMIKAYPQGEERKAINAVFDEIVADLKRQHILTHADMVLPLKATEKVNEQLSIDMVSRPSVIGQLAAAKVAEKPPAPTLPKKQREAEI